MTPSSATFLSNPGRTSARRAGLLAASALCGVAAMLAQPAVALPGIPGAGSITVSAGGSQPVITAPDPATLEIDLNASRTVINWSSLNVGAGEEMNFRFDAASDIVLNKTTSQIAIGAGATVTGTVGGATGGNIWFYSPQGVIVSPGANMSAGGFVFSGGVGLIDASFVSAADPLAFLRAASNGLIKVTSVSTATSASINAAGDVVLSASSGNLGSGSDVVYGRTAQMSTSVGSITVGEITATVGAATVAAGGSGATVMDIITGATGVTVSSTNNSSVDRAVTTTSGDIQITSNGSASLSSGDSARDIRLVAPQVFMSTADAARSVYVTGTTEATVTNRIFAGDDIEITADGSVRAGGAYLRSTGLGAVGDAHILLRSTGADVVNVNTIVTQGTGAAAGDIILEAATTATLGTASSTRDIKVTGPGGASLSNGAAARDILVAATGGAASVTRANAERDLVWTAADTLALTGVYRAVGTASLVSTGGSLNQTNGELTAGSLSATSATGVSLGWANRIERVVGIQGGSGDVFLNNAEALSITGDISGEDITVVTTAGALSVDSLAQIHATSDLVLTGAAGFSSTTGAGGLVSGDDSVTVTATTGNATAAWLTSGGDVLVKALAGNAALRRAAMVGGGSLDVVATGMATLGADSQASISISNLIQRVGGFGALNVTSSGGDARVFLAGLPGGLTSVSANAATGTATIGVDTGFSVGSVSGHNVSLYAGGGTATAGAITVGGGDYTAMAPNWGGVALNPGGVIRNLSITDTDGGLVLTNALTATGDLALESFDTLTSDHALTAGGTVDVSAAGDVDLLAVTAGYDIIVKSTGGQAILRKADLSGSGAGRDLTLTAAGDAILGDPDYSAITAGNVFSRSGGGTGVVQVKSAVGAAMVHLDTSASIDLMQGNSVDVTIANGPGNFGTVTAFADGIYAEVLNGALTLDTARADNGGVELYGAGGDLTIIGFVHGGDLVHIETDGVLDGALASLISSDGDIGLIGGSVNVGHLTADGMIEVAAMSTDALVQLAEAGDLVIVASIYGNATLRAAEAPEAVVVLAANTATFGADDKASISAANYVVTDAPLDIDDGLQVISFNGDAVVNIDSASNGIGTVGASIGGNATVVQKTGDLIIGEVAGYDITLEAMGGALETGFTTSSGGDYRITAQDFRGDALTPTLFNGTIRDVTITDTLGDLDLGTALIHADRALTIIAEDGAVFGLAQLSAGASAGDGEVSVTGEGIALDTVASDGNLTLNGGTGVVNVVTSVTVDGDYSLTGGALSAAALSPLGAKAGTWALTDTSGDLDFTATPLQYGGDITLTVASGNAIGGDITSDTGDITVAAESGALGALSAANGQMTATATVGGMSVGSARASDLIQVSANAGTADLGAAVLEGTGANTLRVQSSNGDAVLGAATRAAIASTNVVNSAGASTLVEVTSATGKVDVNLAQTNVALTTVAGQGAVRVAAVNGALRVNDLSSAGGAVTVYGPTGELTIDQLTANATSQVNGGGDVRLVSVNVTGDLAVSSGGNLRLGDATPGRVIGVSGAMTLHAVTDIAQQGVLRANSLGIEAGMGIVLLGVNEVAYLDAVTVTSGGFAFNDVLGFQVRGPITAAGQTVDIRSGGAITQDAAGIITAQRLTGSSVGGASFGGANQIVQLGDFTNTGGLFKLVNSVALAIDGAVHSTGAVALTSHGGMRLTALGTVLADGAGDAVVLASDGQFTNDRGADAVTASNAAGRWLIYTQAAGGPGGSTAGNSFNGLAGKSFYGSAYDFGTETFALAPNAGNRFVYAYQPTLTVMPDSVVVTYNGGIPVVSATITGLVNGDTAVDAWSGAPSVSGATSRNVGTYVLTAGAGSLASDLNYAFSYGTGSLRIDAKTITGLLDAADKTYDRTTDAAGSIILSGLVAGDDVSAAGTYAFADWNAGVGKTVTASGVTLSGADAGNYILTPVAAAQADILKKTLSGALTAGNKTYDGSTTASGSIGLTGVIAGDDVSASGTYVFADRNAGTGKVVTVSGAALAGLDAGNYELGAVASALADILRRQLAVSADNGFKAFGEADPALTYRITSGSLVAGDDFTGNLIRAVGENPGDYGIGQGTLGLSANYEVIFVGATFTINPLPSKEQDGSVILKYLTQGPDFTLDWNPALNLRTEGTACPEEGCASPAGSARGAGGE